MSGRRHTVMGRVLGGRVPSDLRRVAPPLPAGAESVPLIGAKPHEVRIQVVTSDRAPPTVIELAAVLGGLLVQVGNWSEPIDKIRGGTERQARAMGDGPATIALLEILDRARTAILDVRAAAIARATPEVDPEEPLAPEVAPEPVQLTTEDLA